MSLSGRSVKEGEESEKVKEKRELPKYNQKMFRYCDNARYMCSEQSPEIPEMKIC